MFSLKRLAGLLFGSFLAVSCTPIPPAIKPPTPQPGGPGVDPNAPGPQPGEPKTPEQIQQEEEERKRQEEEAKKRTEPITPGSREQVKPPPGGYPTAKWAKDDYGKIKPGIVINPYTGKQLNVGRNTPSGTKIRDPRDGNPNRFFYVP